MVGLAAAEAANPRKSLPKAIKQVFWRIALFYLISLTLVGCLVPYDDDRLNAGGAGAADSLFVLAIENAGISGLPSVMNVVVMIAVLSVGNSSVFGSSRTLAALAAAGQAPKIFAYIDKQGRPFFGIIFQCICGLLCFVTASSASNDVFNWLLSLSGLSSLFTWGSINLFLFRFRAALKVQGRTTDELTFTSQADIIGAYWGILLNLAVLVLQFWIALYPIGGSPNVSDFFMSYLGFPMIFAFYFGHKIWKKNWKWYIKAEDIDIDTGRRDLDLDLISQEAAEEKARIAGLPFYYRVYHF